ncbi:aminopeptidase m1 [Quercus suber]|uniref:Aminopeptidase m1 n=1 Tax=Quercus suber TaxID=58331 RepID=A0AAW0LJL4_QUESU
MHIVVIVVAHELAHQWFGNFVEINHARENDEIFDAISYKKGASVIRMLQSYLGAECFQTEDLWAALEEGSDEPVNKLMNSWTRQKGYPVITVEVKDQKLVFEQSQFLASGSHGDGQWIVPITLCCGSYDVCMNFLLESKSGTLDMKEFLSDKSNLASAWVKLNVDQTGFYRVKYDEDLAARLQHAIENKHLSATDRYGILDDSFSLCMARQQSLNSLLNLMGAYREELEYTVLFNLINISYKVERIAADATPELLEYIKQFFVSLFLHLEENTPVLHPDIRKAVYVAVMRKVSTSNRFGYESLLRVYRETDLSQEKTRVLSSLTSSPNPNIILEALNFLLSSEVRPQDAVLGLSVSREGREIAWTWLKFASFEKAKEIEEFFASHTNSKIARTLK